MRELLGKIRTDCVSKLVLDKKNSKKSWQYGYDEEYDIVIISKDGTLGDVYEINGLRIGLPKQPKRKTSFINGDVKNKSKQKWERKPLPKKINTHNKDDEENYQYILQEYKRRKEGVWLYINGEPEYFPGCYYFFLQWFNLGREYPDFRYTQRDLMIFWEACVADRRSYGILYVKNRRLGWSTLQQSECNNRGTNFKEGLIGIISKTGADAKSHFRKVVAGFRKLPFFFQPTTDGTTNPKTELSFVKPAKRITSKTKADYEDGSEALNTYIRHYNTDLNSMDSERISPIMIIDEPGKFPKQVPFSEYWSVAKECLVEGLEIVGKAMVGSTINAPDQGGSEFEIVWNQSDTNKRNANNQTVSGLYRIFIPAEYNIRGFYDEFGYPILKDPEKPIKNNEGNLVKIGAITHLDNTEDGLKNNPEKLASQKRKYPRTITDAFRANNNSCEFNSAKLYEQLDYIQRSMPPSQITVGDLQWIGGIQDTKVKFVPNPEGLFKITWHPPKELQNNYIVTPYGKKPLNAHLGAFGCDPYNRTKTTDGRGSLGAIHGLTKDNYTGVPSNFYFLEYLGRPAKVEYFYEDAIKAMVYYGMPSLIELSNEDFLKTLRRRGYRPFSLNRPGVSFDKLSPTEKELGGAPQQNNKLHNARFYAVESYINDFVGIAKTNENREVGEIGKMYFKETIEQWLKVDTSNTTKFDAYISSGLALIANQRIVKQPTTQVKAFINPLTKYNNKGLVSVKER